MIVIVDYGMGNLRSVEKAFEVCGAEVKVSSQARDIQKAEKIVVPGVGAFGQAMKELKKRKLIEPLKDKIQSGAPYLGLCLGLQLLFTSSQENARVPGLGIIPGSVRRFAKKLKVPHMGWNTLLIQKKNCPLFKNIKPADYFYFVHSYCAFPEDKSWVSAVTPYGLNFCSAIWKDSIFATQFHPEKSQRVGLQVIKNFISYDSHTRN